MLNYRSFKKSQTSNSGSKNLNFTRAQNSRPASGRLASASRSGRLYQPRGRQYLAGPGAGLPAARYNKFTSNLPRMSRKRAAPSSVATISKIARQAVLDNHEQKFVSVNYNAHQLKHNTWSKGPGVFIFPYKELGNTGTTMEFPSHTNMLQQIRPGGEKGQRTTSHIQVQSLDLDFKIRTLKHAPATKYRIVVYTTPYGSPHAESSTNTTPLPPMIHDNADASNNYRAAGGGALTEINSDAAANTGIFGYDSFHCMVDQSEKGVMVLCDEIIHDKTPPAIGQVSDAAQITSNLSEFTYKISVALNKPVEYLANNIISNVKKNDQTNIHVAMIAYNPNEHKAIAKVLAKDFSTATAHSELKSAGSVKLCELDCRYTIYFKENM